MNQRQPPRLATYERPPLAQAEGEIRRRLGASEDRQRLLLAVSAQNLDTVLEVDRIAADHEERIKGSQAHPGGSGANTAAAVATLGQQTAVAGVVSDDEAGDRLLEALAKAGVDTELVLRTKTTLERYTGRTMVFADKTGGRAIYVDPGVNEEFATIVHGEANAYDALTAACRSSRILHFSSFSGVAELNLQNELVQEVISDGDLLVSLTPGALYASRGLDALDVLFRRANLVFLYQNQLQALVERSSARVESPPKTTRDYVDRFFAWRAARSKEPIILAIKLGFQSPSGDFLLLAAGSKSVEAVVSVPLREAITQRVVDSTGAGDSIAAGMHVGLANGRSLNECADISCLAANLACRAIGPRAGLSSGDEFRLAWQRRFPGRKQLT